MAILNLETIKEIVRSNFDSSSALYEKFEQTYGLFETLTKHLAAVCELRPEMRVCDIGCGTGTSSVVLADIVGSNGMIFGIDFSEQMLEVAKAKLRTQNMHSEAKKSIIKFIRCSADAIDQYVEAPIDSVMYNACIFLIPDYERSFMDAYNLLLPLGTVGMNYLMGIFDKDYGDGNNSKNFFDTLKNSGKAFAPYGRQIVDTSKLGSTLAKSGFKDIKEGIIAMELTLSELQEFYSIPAQSAGLWPKHSYDDRIIFIKELVNYFEDNGLESCYQYWGWVVGRK